MFSKFVGQMDLMGEMFSRTGAIGGKNLDESAASNLRQAMFRCAKCEHVEECRHFLASSEGAIEAPAFCANANLITTMQDA